MRKILIGLLGAALFIAAVPAVGEAASKAFSTTKTVTGPDGKATCPSKWKLTGGGAGPLPANSFKASSSDQYVLKSSYPTGSSWKVDARKIHGALKSGQWVYTESSYSTKAYAICIK